MKIRDRIKELRRVRASDLVPNAKNWRTHSPAQQDAMRGILAEVGYADALLAYETPEGLKLVDGHLRAEITPDAEVPVLILDINEEEAEKILLTHDPIAAMAGANAEALAKLMADVGTKSEALTEMLGELAAENGIEPKSEDPVDAEPSTTLAERFGVPPFSVLDARQGYWQDRKRAWLSLGIQSELGRGMCRPHGKDTRPVGETGKGKFAGGDCWKG